MIKEIIDKNSQKKANSRITELLKKDFPQCFGGDGAFDWVLFESLLKTAEVDIKKEGYSLDFLGKSYARYLSSLDSETVIVPDEKNKDINSQNVYIVGDNLDALQHLKYSYAEKIKCIYIDPPYNTGTDGFVYNDKFDFSAEELAKKINIEEEEAQRVLDMQGTSTHSAWLTFMYPRLELARDLLTDDGVIFISIDDNEQANCKLLCDSVFGEANFVAEFVWKCRNSLQHDEPLVSKQTERILFYVKNAARWDGDGNSLNRIRKPFDATEYKNPDNDPRGPWLSSGKTRNDGRPSYTVTSPAGVSFTKPWVPSPEEFARWEKEGLIWWGVDGKSIPRKKSFLKDFKGNAVSDILFDEYTDEIKDGNNLKRTKRWEIGTTEAGTKGVKELFDGATVFDYPKPWTLIEYLITIATDSDDIILDFFSGSATTAHAVMQRNVKNQKHCKYILVQIDEPVKKDSEAEKAGYKTIDEIGRERIRRAAKSIAAADPEKAKGADLEFKTYYLKEADKETLDKIVKFDPNFVDNGADIKDKFGSDTVLTTWKIRDGYGFNAEVRTVDLKGYSAYLLSDSRVGTTLYLIDDMPEKAIVELVRKIEAYELDLDRIVEYGYAFGYTSNTALRSNLKTLKNIKPIEPIIRY